jgi:alkanesulfonate monooxygenase SsuD/methylene tetrahydromethanopterin reductase-like flavin-dependent oxidoreductase (luciferase family)
MSPEEHRSKMEIVRRHCEDLGRDPSEIEITHNTRVIIAESEQKFEELAIQGAAGSNISVTDYKKSLSGAIAGTPEQCAQQLSKYVADGIRYFFLLFPDPITDENLDLFASEVIPYFT